MEGQSAPSMNYMISLACKDDIPGMLEIYRPIVEGSHTSFEYAVPAEEVFSNRVLSVLEKFPWIVYREGDKVIGYAYAGQLRGRPAYSWSSELSVYVHEAYQGMGLGRNLYKCLIDLLKWQGVRNFYGVIALPNDNSERFHLKLGFEKVSVMPAAGFKKRWVDLAWYLLRSDDDSEPAPLRSMEELRSSDEVARIFSTYNAEML